MLYPPQLQKIEYLACRATVLSCQKHRVMAYISVFDRSDQRTHFHGLRARSQNVEQCLHIYTSLFYHMPGAGRL